MLWGLGFRLMEVRRSDMDMDMDLVVLGSEVVLGLEECMAYRVGWVVVMLLVPGLGLEALQLDLLVPGRRKIRRQARMTVHMRGRVCVFRFG